MKHLVNDKRNCMATESVSAELKTRLNTTALAKSSGTLEKQFSVLYV